jgi:hypothetical protein
MSAFHTQAAGQGDLAQLEALKGRTTMWTKQRASLLLAGAVVALVAITGEPAYAQAEGPNSVKRRPLPSLANNRIAPPARRHGRVPNCFFVYSATSVPYWSNRGYWPRCWNPGAP